MKKLIAAALLLSGSAIAQAPAQPAPQANFSCTPAPQSPSPIWMSDCNQAVLDLVKAQCGATSAPKITKVSLIGTTNNAAGGCNHTFAADTSVTKGACAGASNMRVVIMSTRGGCLVQ